MALELPSIAGRLLRGISMTLRIERHSDGDSTTIRLIGRMRTEHVEEVERQIRDSGRGLEVALDLRELNLVDVQTVRFLGRCESQGVRLTNCSAFVRDWIAKEKEPNA